MSRLLFMVMIMIYSSAREDFITYEFLRGSRRNENGKLEPSFKF